MTFKTSASHLKLFLLCPRSWHLKHVLRAPDDQNAGGLYLTRGNDFDRLVQLYVRDGVTGDSGASKLANRQLAEARRYLPNHGQAAVQFSYNIPHPAGFVVTGKPDLRRPGFVQDTKTTSDRGPGRGAAEDRPAYALTDETLRHDEQALLYSWCEFQLDPGLDQVTCEWVYVSKADAPKAWVARCVITRAEAEAWFDAVVLPAVAGMRALAESGLPADRVGANPDSCRRCFVRTSCPGPFEGVNVFGVAGPTREKGTRMAFDLNRLKPAAAPAPAAPAPDLEATLAASVAVVAINRPASQRPAPPPAEDAEALTVTTIEGPVAAFGQLEYPKESPRPDLPILDVADEETPPAPKARRGRPRKPPEQPSGETATTVVEATTAGIDVALVRDLLQRALVALGGGS